MSNLRSIVIAFELPVFKENLIDIPSINEKIFNKYLFYINVIKSEFTIIKLDNDNKCLLYELISLFDSSIMSNIDRESDYDKMKNDIKSLIESELKFNNLIYKEL